MNGGARRRIRRRVPKPYANCSARRSHLAIGNTQTRLQRPLNSNNLPAPGKENPGTADRRHRAIERFTMKQILRSASVCNGSIVYSLHRGRSQRVIVRVVPDYQTALYRIAWPDIGFSGTANLTRCKDAAREWAERNAVLEDRKTNAARRLKSLDNFWWSSSHVAQNLRGAA